MTLTRSDSCWSCLLAHNQNKTRWQRGDFHQPTTVTRIHNRRSWGKSTMASGAVLLFAILFAANSGTPSEAAECQRLLVPAYYDSSSAWQQTFQQGDKHRKPIYSAFPFFPLLHPFPFRWQIRLGLSSEIVVINPDSGPGNKEQFYVQITQDALSSSFIPMYCILRHLFHFHSNVNDLSLEVTCTRAMDRETRRMLKRTSEIITGRSCHHLCSVPMSMATLQLVQCRWNILRWNRCRCFLCFLLQVFTSLRT